MVYPSVPTSEHYTSFSVAPSQERRERKCLYVIGSAAFFLSALVLSMEQLYAKIQLSFC